MDRTQNRLKKVKQLVKEAGGLARFAEIVGISASQAWQIAGNAPVRGIGSKMAARIEQAFRKPAGWLDWPGDDASLSTESAEGGDWPFPTVLRADYERLSKSEKRDLETTVKRFVAGCLAQRV